MILKSENHVIVFLSHLKKLLKRKYYNVFNCITVSAFKSVEYVLNLQR